MDEIVIEGVHPYDGRWPLDLERRELTTREWGWIKRLAGYLPLDLVDESKYGDPELITVLATIALKRAAQIEADQVPKVFERLSDAPFGAAITLEAEQPQEDDAGPPARSSNGSSAGSGPASPTSSDTSAPTPSSSGTPASGSSPSGPSTLVT